MAKTGKLFLIPTTIAEHTQDSVIPIQSREGISALQFFLAENIRTARRYLSRLNIYEKIDLLHFQELNKKTKETDLPELMSPLFQGHDLGVLSESGSPGIADPGSLAVAYAHTHGVKVIPLVGPSSIFLALMASGLNGQQFAFHGYLPIQSQEVSAKIKGLEAESRKKKQTQIFIETPYRNQSIFNHLLNNLSEQTQLTVAQDVTGEHESISTLTVKDWKKKKVTILKVPSIFLFLAR